MRCKLVPVEFRHHEAVTCFLSRLEHQCICQAARGKELVHINIDQQCADDMLAVRPSTGGQVNQCLNCVSECSLFVRCNSNSL